MNTENKTIEPGIQGWLILLAFGIVVGPFYIMAVLLMTYVPIFQDGTFDLLTDPSSAIYSSYWAPYLYGEIICNLLMLIVSIYLAYLFFSHKKQFPRTFVIFRIVVIVFIIVDAFSIKLVMPDEPVFDSETTRMLINVVLYACVWIPYVCISERVKVTFVK